MKKVTAHALYIYSTKGPGSLGDGCFVQLVVSCNNQSSTVIAIALC